MFSFFCLVLFARLALLHSDICPRDAESSDGDEEEEEEEEEEDEEDEEEEEG